MKSRFYLFLLFVSAITVLSCNNTDYKKTSSGLLYKIFPSDSNDSLATTGNWMKILYVQKINDSVLQSNYGKMPLYINVNPSDNSYNPIEILSLLKKGDSAVTVMITDSLLSKNLAAELPPFMKKGDRLITSFKVLEVFRNDSTYFNDFKENEVTYAPIMEQERQEQEKRMREEMMAQKKKELEEMENSGEAEAQRKEVESYLTAKGIKTTKTAKGTYVAVIQEGTGTVITPGKYVSVKYTGKLIPTDSTFQSSVYSFQIGEGQAIEGWDDGLQLFKEGGKGTLFIPAYMAYGKNPGPGNKPNEPLLFDIEVLKVSDGPIAQ